MAMLDEILCENVEPSYHFAMNAFHVPMSIAYALASDLDEIFADVFGLVAADLNMDLGFLLLRRGGS